MRFDHNESGNVITLTPGGPLDKDGAPELVPAVERAVQQAHRRFVLDLTRVPFADSVGLEVIITIARHITQSGGRLGIFGATDLMKQIFKATRLDQRLEILESREQALAELRAED